MVKFFTPAIVLLLSGCYLVIPNPYFAKYAELSRKPITNSNLKLIGSYIYVDSIPNSFMSDRFHRLLYDHKIISFYNNHMTSSFMFPIQLDNGDWILTLSD